MKNALQTLSRIEKFNINEQRRLLVACQEQQDAFQLQLDNLNLSFEREKEFYRRNEMVGDFGAYLQRYLEQKNTLEQQIAELEQQITVIRNKISDMFKEQKTYEIIDSDRHARALHEEDLKIQKQLDEIGTNAYIKHHEKQKQGE